MVTLYQQLQYIVEWSFQRLFYYISKRYHHQYIINYMHNKQQSSQEMTQKTTNTWTDDQELVLRPVSHSDSFSAINFSYSSSMSGSISRGTAYSMSPSLNTEYNDTQYTIICWRDVAQRHNKFLMCCSVKVSKKRKRNSKIVFLETDLSDSQTIYLRKHDAPHLTIRVWNGTTGKGFLQEKMTFQT